MYDVCMYVSLSVCLSGGCIGGVGFGLFYAVALKLGESVVVGLATSLGTSPNEIYWPFMAVLFGIGGACGMGVVSCLAFPDAS